MRNVEQVGNKLVYKRNVETLAIEPWGENGLRVRSTANPEILDTPWALLESVDAEGSIEISENHATIGNGKISARIQDIRTQSGWLQFFKHTEDGEQCVLSEYNYRVGANNPGTRSYRPVGGDLYHSEVHFAANEDERLYGLGQNANGFLNQKGCVIDLYQRHVKAVIPFIVSNQGYGFLWNNPGLGRAELGYDRTRWIAYGCKQMDYYITAGDSYAEILERYADVTGHAPMLPYWASGFWQCKNRYKTQEEFLEVAREYKRRSLPLSVLVIDYLHWERTGDWKLDPEFWPDPEAMVKELDEMGVRIMISPWFLVNRESENFQEMYQGGMFLTHDDGSDTVFFGGIKSESPVQYHYDPTNPEATRFLWKKWEENYFDLGIRTFWLDPCDTIFPSESYDKVRYHIGTGTEVHCYFPIAHQKAIYEGLHEAGEQEVVTICRSAWAGSQRYGAALWSGDIESSFVHLSDYMKAGLNVAMSGLPWWTTDIGGFATGDPETPYFRELIVRWYQYGVFCPLFRTHSKGRDNEAWSFGEEAYRHIRPMMFLRERLRPYVMEQMKHAHERGLPSMRPVFFDFQDDPEVEKIEDQFLFGPDLLVAPITEYQSRSREVYLPVGVDWTNVWTGEKLAGGQYIVADAPLEQIPVYIRGDNPELLELFKGLYDL